jgi:peroxiredoxin
MNSKFLRIYPWGAAAVLLLGVLWIAVSRVNPDQFISQGIQAPQEGLLAPDFSLETLEGTSVSLKDYRGRPVLINFWASWCPPCRSEMPAMEKMYREFKNTRFEILAVNVTNQDRLADVESFVDQHQLSFPIPLDRTGQISELYRINSLPTSFFVDKNGVIQKVIIGGPMREALIYRQVENLLED